MTNEQVPAESLSDTPRTDANQFQLVVSDDTYGKFRRTVVGVEFARQLERELNEAKSLNATLERSNHRLRAKFDRSYP